MTQDWYPKSPLVWQADTLTLDPYDEGLYCRLVDWYYINRRPPPDNDAALAAICRIPVEKWAEHAAIVRAFFKPKGGLLHHKKCDAELDAQDRRSNKRSSDSARAAKIRWGQDKDLDADGMAGAGAPHTVAMRTDATGQDKTGEEATTTEASLATPSTETTKGRLAKKNAPGLPGLEAEGWHQGKAPGKRGTRMGPDQQPSEADVAFASSQGLNPMSTWAEFRDHWLGVPGDRGLKLDWSATFRNRCRQVVDWRKLRGSNGSNGRSPPPRELSPAEKAEYRKKWGLERAGRAELQRKIQTEGLSDRWHL